jgi:phosphoglycerate kinase
MKMDKLDDLEGIVERKNLRMIIAGGALAMPLLKESYELAGKQFSVGLAEHDPANKAYIEPKRFEQAKRIIQKCMTYNIELVLPIDFILDNNQVSTVIPEDRAQLDIGPETRKLYAEKVRLYIEEGKRATTPFVMFYNGVFGKFEDPQFEQGTKDFISHLKDMHQAGVQIYVGGGEGREALEKYGSLDDVTHAFTAGGTILTSLTNNHIAYLKAMYLQNTLRK